MEKAVSPCSEMTIVKKYEKHYIDIRSKKDTTTKENSPKAQDVKTKMLKQFIQSQIDEDTSHQDKIRVTGTLERNTHITNKDMTRIDLTVKVVINLMTESAMRMTAEEPELLGTLDQSEEPAKKRRMTYAERASYGNAQKVSIYATE